MQSTFFNQNELLSGLRNQSIAAYECIYDRHAGPLYNIILQMVQDEQAASEVLVELFTTVHADIVNFVPENGSLFSWMYRLARKISLAKVQLSRPGKVPSFRVDQHESLVVAEVPFFTVHHSPSTDNDEVRFSTIMRLYSTKLARVSFFAVDRF